MDGGGSREKEGRLKEGGYNSLGGMFSAKNKKGFGVTKKSVANKTFMESSTLSLFLKRDLVPCSFRTLSRRSNVILVPPILSTARLPTWFFFSARLHGRGDRHGKYIVIERFF